MELCSSSLESQVRVKIQSLKTETLKIRLIALWAVVGISMTSRTR